MTDEFDDILGPATKNKGGRPVGSKTKPRPVHPPLKPVMRSEEARSPVGRPRGQTAADLSGGVTVFWLAKVFGLEVSVVRKKIADCPPFARKTSGFTYALADVAPYLVRPRINVTQYLAEMDPRDLPQQLQGAYWEANLKRQKFESLSKQLWETEDVLEVFSEVFKTIKFTVQLWPDTLERESNLSDEDRATLVRLADAMQDEIFKGITRLAADKSTPSAWERFLEREARKDLDSDIILEDIL